MSTIDEYHESLAEPAASVARKLEPLLSGGLPAAEGKVWHGHPVWMNGKDPVAGYKAYPKYVTLMFWAGQNIDDPAGVLQAGSQNMASVKLASAADVDEALVTDWLRQAAALAR